MLTKLPPREEFIENNLGLAHTCAGRFKGRGIEYDDLYAAACMGLIKSYDGFDVTRGVCFSTYAVPVILGEIKKLFRDGGLVKVSRSLKELSLKINAVRERVQKKTGNEPTVSEIAKELDISEEQVIQAVSASQPTVSLTPSGEEGEIRQMDLPVESHETALSDKLALREELQRLAEEDRKLIYYRFYKGKTQTQTAELLGTTQVQVSRRERKIIANLRQRLLE